MTNNHSRCYSGCRGIDVTEYSLRLVRVDTGDVAASFEDKTPTWLAARVPIRVSSPLGIFES